MLLARGDGTPATDANRFQFAPIARCEGIRPGLSPGSP